MELAKGDNKQMKYVGYYMTIRAREQSKSGKIYLYFLLRKGDRECTEGWGSFNRVVRKSPGVGKPAAET